ncbi:MAG: hypothetical protein FWC43_13665 [Planctomycetaceae bacterium]|nr:hypothetical protein [Planctomycetaceae bacterium]
MYRLGQGICGTAERFDRLQLLVECRLPRFDGVIDLFRPGRLFPQDDIMALWRQVFGDPDEWERKQAERDTLVGRGESEEARRARERVEYVQRNFLR